MTWTNLRNNGRVEPHVTSKGELDDLRAAIHRNLNDATIKELSDDNRFIIAYQAALLAAKMAVACAGYRVKGHGAHQTTFQALRLALGPSADKAADYLDRCRRKRNDLAYESEGVVSATDAAELLSAASALYQEVQKWIASHHQKLA